MLRTVSLALSLFIFWACLSGHGEAHLLALGALSALLAVLAARALGTADHEGHPIHLLWRLPGFLTWLTIEVAKANWDVARRLWRPGPPISPTRLTLPAGGQGHLGRAIHANTITLTPGTLCTRLEGDTLEVHALTRETARELASGRVGRRVRRLTG